MQPMMKMIKIKSQINLSGTQASSQLTTGFQTPNTIKVSRRLEMILKWRVKIMIL